MARSENPNHKDYSMNPLERSGFSHTDPLRRSTKSTFLFPAKAAARLIEQRKGRYDILSESDEEVELRLRTLASIMGMLPTNDESPSAA
jgi:hypothetical protein